MSLLDTYRQKLELQIQEHKARLDLLKARAKQAAAQGQIELARADKHMQQVKAHLKKLKGAGGHAYDDIKSGVVKALGDLTASTKKAASHFNSHPPHRAKKKKTAKAAKKVKRVVKTAKAKATKVVKAAKAKVAKSRKR